ncbi:MAG: hypothetical protein A3J28_07880 [Acidobacteria bacterium RIFCSPLOWO2_12_FULL_60_22]|nr:MAG: hypothetical protein A3J28_07880 [Acidobacteria bacterium RIFCSPLOWO2_12_FULL_60_22]
MPRERAHRLFSQLSVDLAKITADYPAQVLCPLCLTPFTKEAIDLEEPDLTEEHIIPEKLGGTLVTLTCKRCNNTYGSKVEAHLVQMLRSHDSLKGTSNRPLRGRMEIGGMTVPADIEWKAAETTTIRLRPFKPAVHEAIKKHLRDGTDEINLNLNFRYIPLRSYVAVFRIAYLAMFRELSYGYILSRAAGAVREIIARFENAPEQLGDIVGEAKNMSPAPTEPLQFYAVRGGIAVMVVITLLADTKRHYVTFMPSPELAPEMVLETLLAAAQTVGKGRPAKDQ